MWPYIIKVGITALIVVIISEVAKRSSFWAAALASLPLMSLLAFIWLYIETGDVYRIAGLAQNIFWLVLPSLVLFLLLPVLLRAGWGFWPSLGVSCVATAGVYAFVVWLLTKASIQI